MFNHLKVTILFLFIFIFGCWEESNSPVTSKNPPEIGFDLELQSTGEMTIDSSFIIWTVVTGENITIKWYKDDTLLSEYSDSLKFDTLKYSDSGNYVLIASNNYGSDTSLAFSVTFPVIIDTTDSIPVSLLNEKKISTIGTPALDSVFALFIQAEGTDTIKYQWYKNDTIPLASGIDDTLLFSSLSTENIGNYKCIASNEFGADTSLSFNLIFTTVDDSTDSIPASLLDDKKISTIGTLLPDSAFALFIQAKGTDTIKYQWYKNDTIPLASGIKDTLLFSSLTTENIGNYKCIVSNEFGADTSVTYNLIFTIVDDSTDSIPATILNEKKVSTIGTLSPDSAFTLFIQAAGTDTIKYQWYKNDTIPLSTETNDTLKFDSLSIENVGAYKCIVSNNYGSDTSVTYTLSLNEFFLPVITSNGAVNTIGELKKNTAYKMYISVDGMAPFAFQWYKNSIAIENANSDTLSFPSLSNPDSGSYHCVVTNVYGSDTSLISLVTFNNSAPTSKDTTVSIIEDSTFSLNIIADDIDKQVLSWNVITSPLYGSLDKQSGTIDSIAAEFSYRSNNLKENKSDLIKIEISDGALKCTTNININISADNDAPIIDSIKNIVVDEDNTAGAKFDIFAHDPEGETVVWSIVENPSKGTLSEVISEISALTFEGKYVPSANLNGKDSIIIRISDGATTTQNITIPIIINSINDKPTITVSASDVNFGSDMLISTTNSDVEGVKSLKIYINGILKDSVASPTSNYSYTWPAEPFNDTVIDVYSIKAIVEDSDGLKDSAETTAKILGTWISDSLSVVDIYRVNYRMDKTEMFKVYNITIKDNRLTELNFSTYSSKPYFDSIPRSIGNLTALDSLYFKYGEATTIPNEISKLKNLKFLNIYSLKLLSIPNNFGELTNLENLTISTTQISEIPETIGNLTKLKKLVITNNSITLLPANIGNLTNLEEFSFGGDTINNLPDEFCNLSSLKILSLGYTGLNELPTNFGNLSNLVEANLSGNNLTTLPKSVQYLASIEKLNLSMNSLDSLPSSFSFIASLKSLQIDNNNLVTLPDFSKLKNLTSLIVSSNKLITLPEGLGSIPTLNSISAERNVISVLPVSLCSSKSIRSLYIANNELTDLPDQIVNLTTVTFLTLGNNRLSNSPVPAWNDWATNLDSDWATTQK